MTKEEWQFTTDKVTEYYRIDDEIKEINKKINVAMSDKDWLYSTLSAIDYSSDRIQVATADTVLSKVRQIIECKPPCLRYISGLEQRKNYLYELKECMERGFRKLSDLEMDFIHYRYEKKITDWNRLEDSCLNTNLFYLKQKAFEKIFSEIKGLL